MSTREYSIYIALDRVKLLPHKPLHNEIMLLMHNKYCAHTLIWKEPKFLFIYSTDPGSWMLQKVLPGLGTGYRGVT